MRALLLKDFDVLQHGNRIYLILLAIFALLPGSGFTGFALIYAAMMPYQAFAYDERSKWDTLASMMPYSTHALVTSKYMLGWASIACAMLLGGVSRLVQLAAGRTEALEDLVSLIPIGAIALLILSITLPLACRFGVEKGRLLFMGIIALSAIGLVSGMGALDGMQLSDGMAWGALLGLAAAGILTQPISIWFSEKLYRRRFYEGAA
ncbi:MAG: ABC-2 transporter permease [Faecalibacterium sp.]|jgi:hypothetical protein|nr:ABC-2 transporter permease [Faecalibacterium sp.]